MDIIGIGGLSRSGKDTLAEWFIENGYFGVSLGDIVRNRARTRHADQPDPISVANMTETANRLRQSMGADFALREAVEQFNRVSKDQPYKGLVVYSVRAPAEADFILNHDGKLVWVETTDRVRYERALKFMREGEAPISFDEFMRQENLQWQPQPNVPAEAQMNVQYVKSKATVAIENNTDDVETFKDEAKKSLSKILLLD